MRKINIISDMNVPIYIFFLYENVSIMFIHIHTTHIIDIFLNVANVFKILLGMYVI